MPLNHAEMVRVGTAAHVPGAVRLIRLLTDKIKIIDLGPGTAPATRSH